MGFYDFSGAKKINKFYALVKINKNIQKLFQELLSHLSYTQQLLKMFIDEKTFL